MSTYFNEQTKEYENFETAIMTQLERIDGVLGISGSQEEDDEAEEEDEA